MVSAGGSPRLGSCVHAELLAYTCMCMHACPLLWSHRRLWCPLPDEHTLSRHRQKDLPTSTPFVQGPGTWSTAGCTQRPRPRRWQQSGGRRWRCRRRLTAATSCCAARRGSTPLSATWLVSWEGLVIWWQAPPSRLLTGLLCLALPPSIDTLPCPPVGFHLAGAETVRRVKSGGTTLRLKGGLGGRAAARSYFWRSALDPATLRCVTDIKAKEFLDTE